MNPKSLRVTTAIKSEHLEGAIADLAGRYLRATKTGARVVTQPTEFPVSSYCAPLLDDWHSGKVGYAPGSITLVFSGGRLDEAADLLIYKPEGGDRLLYGNPSASRRESQLPLPLGSVTDNPAQASVGKGDRPRSGAASDDLERQVQALSDILVELTEHQRAVESRLRERAGSVADSVSNSASNSAANSAANSASNSASNGSAAGLSAPQIQKLLEAQAASFAQMLTSQMAATTRHIGQRLDQIQTQLEQIQAQLDLPEELADPQTEADWQQRIQATWGTVGDYEQYSASHREANAETPLFHTPDWVALCELDWARRLHPVLAQLHQMIHGEEGIGYAGADVLQQFGCHVDARTGDRYYIYKLGGFSAYDALWQTATHPQQSWLPALQRLRKKAARFPDVFHLFGWEPEAIAALDTVVEWLLREKQSAGQHSAGSSYGPNYAKRPGNTIPDYLALLNLGPFTPLTPESLKRAYKQAMKTAHPDTGGSKELAQRVNEAYEAVLRHYFPSA
ncbi:hypothetical protein [Thermoleptolyngbya sp. M55_K2018_002]|uniref:hypothetical protein n=1 Tax=Thermoleptolyngbya sp. M55_K2018_002 TaxID=2747808 RepID=UPI0019F92D6C|nr:hypothetical protein [Thermoleptolyngbya sp. M55_K2018_002]HIK40468.1 hypothetical protein [Thermoleptolyngbya sp. M55_K2018_002]